MTKRPPKIMTLDTETLGLDGPLKRIAVYDGEEVTRGYIFEDVFPAIYKWYNAGYMPVIYIHNADFDLRKLPEIFEPGNVVWSRTKVIGSKYARVTCKDYIIQDSYKLLPFSLDKLSKDFGVEHGKVDLWEAVQKAYPGQYKDKVDFFIRCDKDDPIYLEYLDYDVISLYEVLYKLIEVSGIPEDKITGCLSTASMSKFVLRNGYNGRPFETDGVSDYDRLISCKAWSSQKTMKYCNISYMECEYKMREGFYGGRTEVFTPNLEAVTRNGERQIVGYHYDVNSLYPSVMIDNDFPIGFPEYETDERLIRLNWNDWTKDHIGLGFIKATVYIPPQDIPPLPAKLGKLAFVTGFVKGTWTYNELEYAVVNCGVEIIHFHEQIHFKRTHKVFHNFVRVFYELKAEGKQTHNGSLTAFAKLMLNTAYGWTVLRRDDKTCFRDISQKEKYVNTDKFIVENDELGYVEIWDTVLSDSIQVQVGAYVTSYARLVLLDALREQVKAGKVYYCDTDSIVCEKPFPSEKVDKTQLGKWDLEGKLYSGLFLQPKVYTEEKEGEPDTIKFKGVTRKTQATFTRLNYEEIYKDLKAGKDEKITIEIGRETLPSLKVAQKKKIDPNVLKVSNKSLDLGAKAKREFDYQSNTSTAWHMETLDDFDSFSFEKWDNPPEGENLFGG